MVIDVFLPIKADVDEGVLKTVLQNNVVPFARSGISLVK